MKAAWSQLLTLCILGPYMYPSLEKQHIEYTDEREYNWHAWFKVSVCFVY